MRVVDDSHQWTAYHYVRGTLGFRFEPDLSRLFSCKNQILKLIRWNFKLKLRFFELELRKPQKKVSTRYLVTVSK